MEDPGNELIRAWNQPFWLQVRAQAVGTVLGTGMVALIAGGAAGLTRLSLGEALLYVVLPIVFVGIILGVVLAVRAMVRRLRQFDRWRELVSNHAAVVGHMAQDVALREVIDAAEDHGWTARRERGVLILTSPDQPSDDYPVDPTELDPIKVARDLNRLAPLHFPEEWWPSVDRVASVETQLENHDESLKALEASIDEIDAEMRQGFMRGALATTAAEAKATYGWQVHWLDERVIFTREKNGEQQRCTVEYNEELDLAKLRKALGLTPWGSKY